MEKEHNQWCEITGIRVGDKVCVVAPYPNWSIHDDDVGQLVTVKNVNWRPAKGANPPVCLIVNGLRYGRCIPFWCLVKVEDKND